MERYAVRCTDSGTMTRRAVSGPTRAIATSLRAKVLRGVGPRDFQPRRSPGFRHSDWVTRPSRDSNRIGLGSGRTDRKSTRLNSSHLVISYAVFCLKKKKV